MLSLPYFVLDISPPFHTAKITEIDGVFLFALLAINHFMSGDVRKHSLNKITTVWADDVPQGQVLRFLFRNLQLAPDLRRNISFLMISSDLVHNGSPAFPNPISPVINSERSCLLRIPSSLSRIRNAVKDAPIVFAMSRMSSLSSARRILSP